MQYTLNLTMHRNGFHSGTYYYDLPAGVKVVEGNTGVFAPGGVEVGTWKVTEEGRIICELTDKINSLQNVTITAMLGVTFDVMDDPIDFDGKTTVVVHPKPTTGPGSAELNKWGNRGMRPKDRILISFIGRFR